MDGPDGFRPAILRAGIRMPFKDNLVEGDRGHLGGILGALGQAGQELRPQPFDLFGREDRMAEYICQQVEHERQIFDERTPGEPGVMCARAEGQARADRFECIEDLLEVPGFGATHQAEMQ